MINFYHTPRLGHLKPNITYLCDLGCPNCNRAVKHAPSSTEEDLSPNQFAKMLLDESPKCNKVWNHITLTGGEPTLHPHFDQFIDILAEYKKMQPHCIIETYTYNHPKYNYKIEEALKKYPYLSIKNTDKKSPKIHRYASYKAPIDNPQFGPNYSYNGCHQGCHICGLGYDYKGFYCCSMGAAIARVFNLDIAIKDLSIISTPDIVTNRIPLMAQYAILCPKCGFFNCAKARTMEEPMSQTWIKAFEEYKIKYPNRKWNGNG